MGTYEELFRALGLYDMHLVYMEGPDQQAPQRVDHFSTSLGLELCFSSD